MIFVYQLEFLISYQQFSSHKPCPGNTQVRLMMCIELGDGKFARYSCASVAHNDLHPRESSPTLNLCEIKQFPRARMTQTVL